MSHQPSTMSHRERGTAPRLRPLAVAAVLALTLAAPAPAEPPIPALNEKVAEFARTQLGKKVGDGECTALALAALRHAGAQRFPLSRRHGDFVWGRLVDHPSDALPGDILQFRNAVFQGKRWVTKRRWVTWHHEYPHHTAIVASVGERGKVLTILHQNTGAPGTDEDRKRLVQEGTIRMDSLQEGGWVRIYRPVAPADPIRE
jgi:hypothetical protein